MQIYNDEIKHVGVLGMKWGRHRAQVKLKKAERKAEDKRIMDARAQTGTAMEEYNRKAAYSNKNLHDKKAYKDADEAYARFVKIASEGNVQTHKEKGRAAAAKALLIIGAMSYVSGIAYSTALMRR